MKLREIVESGQLSTRLLPVLAQLRPQFAKAAQAVYDEWTPGDDGDDEFGSGGICDAIANAIGDVLSSNGIDYTEGGHDGDDHAYLVAYNDQEAYVVDIPYHVYESGGGYNWSRIPDVQFTPEDVVIAETDRPDWIDDNYE